MTMKALHIKTWGIHNNKINTNVEKMNQQGRN